jgi:hypothetical protein
MPKIIDPETIYVDDLPGIWSPVQWELSEPELAQELEDQATASLLWAVDAPQTILRLLLSETGIERAFEPPEGYDPEEQGAWEKDLVAFQFKRPIQMEHVEREQDYLLIEYNFGSLGKWAFEIEPEKVTIERL